MMKTSAYIDASNLFYGGEKSLGWKIDYRKLYEYLKQKYEVSSVFYYPLGEYSALSSAEMKPSPEPKAEGITQLHKPQ